MQTNGMLVVYTEISLSHMLALWYKTLDLIEILFQKMDSVNQLLQLCTARSVFSILVGVRLYTMIPEVCHWLTKEKERKTDIRLTDQ